MNRLIIDNQSGLSAPEALRFAAIVASWGKISETGKGKQYCFHSEFDGGIHVSVFKNAKSERFLIYKSD